MKPIADQAFHNVASRLLLHVSRRPDKKTLLLACSQPGEGTSTVLCRLGRELVRDSDLSVLLVDANLRTPALHAFWGLPLAPGLLQRMDGAADRDAGPLETSQPNLSVLPAGGTSPNPTGLFLGAAFRETLKQLRSRYDLLLFDSPPLAQFNDALAIGSELDGAVLLVRANYTTRASAQRSLQRLADRNIEVRAAIFNRRRAAVPGWMARVLRLQDEG